MDGTYDAEQRALCAVAKAAACANEAMVTDVMRLLRTIKEGTGEEHFHIPVNMDAWEDGSYGPVHHYGVTFRDGYADEPLITEVADPGRMCPDDDDLCQVGFVLGNYQQTPLRQVHQNALERMLCGYRRHGVWQWLARFSTAEGQMSENWIKLWPINDVSQEHPVLRL